MLLNYTNIEDNTPITANVFNERFGDVNTILNGGIAADNIANSSITAAKLASGVFEAIYPIGSLYFNATDNTDPSTLLGFGTWVAFAAGKVVVGYDSTDTDFNASEKTGGSKELQTHTHAIDPPVTNTSTGGDHTHNTYANYGVAGGVNTATGAPGDARGNATTSAGSHSHTVDIASFTSGSAGTGTAGNLQPFITVYCWKRVS